MNIGAGDVLSNTVVAKVGADGKISIYNNTGQVNIAIDVLGWFPTGDAFTGVQPARVAETRSGPGLETVDGLFEGGGPVVGGTSLGCDRGWSWWCARRGCWCRRGERGCDPTRTHARS